MRILPSMAENQSGMDWPIFVLRVMQLLASKYNRLLTP